MVSVLHNERSCLWERRRWLLLALPLALLLGFTLVLPLGFNAYRALFTGSLAHPYGVFCGFGNYRELITDLRFWASMGKGFAYAGESSFLQVALAAVAAIGLRRMSRLSAIARCFCLIPVLIPPAATVAVFRMLFDATYGPLARAFETLVGTKPNFFSEDALLATGSVLTAFQFFPLSFLLLSERIRLIPTSLYQRAELDDLGPWRTLRVVTLPEITPLLLALFALRFCLTFGKFDVLYFLGGTSALLESVESTPLYIYRVGLTQGKLGLGAAASTLVLALVVAVFAGGYLLRAILRRARFRQLKWVPSPAGPLMAKIQGFGAKLGSVMGLIAVFAAILIPTAAVLYGSISARFPSDGLNFTLRNYYVLFQNFDFGGSLLHSLEATVISTTAILVACVPFSFLVWVFRFPGSSSWGQSAILFYCLPPVLLAYGFQSVAGSLNMLGGPFAVSAGMIGFALPLAATVLTVFGNDHPVNPPAESASEAISLTRYFVRVFLPNRIGAMCMAGALVFAACWSDYLFASILGGSRFRTAVVSFQDISQGAVLPWGVLMAAAFVLALPTAAASLLVEFVLKRRDHELRI
jgi:ABC-type sugar transport system permease subunit